MVARGVPQRVSALGIAAALLLSALATPAGGGTIRVKNIQSASKRPPADQVYAPSFAASSAAAGGTLVAFYSQAAPLLDPNDGSAFACNAPLCENALLTDLRTGQLELISVRPDGQDGNDVSGDLGPCSTPGARGCAPPAITPDGRYVAFVSRASDLVAGDTNNHCQYDGDSSVKENCGDVFVRDRQLGTTTRVSVSSFGVEANGASGHPSISADGRFVAFHSGASNLVANDVNQVSDVFLRDTHAGTTIRLSQPRVAGETGTGSSHPAISADGTMVAFESTASNLAPADLNRNCDNNDDGTHAENCADIFVWDATTDGIAMVSVNAFGQQGDDASSSAAIAADGRFVSFESRAGNLVSLDPNGVADVFVHDMATRTTALVSLSHDSLFAEEPSLRSALSADGRFVVFETKARLADDDDNNHVDVYFRDTLRGVTHRLTHDGPPGGRGDSMRATLSADGRFVTLDSKADLIESDDDGSFDVFVLDRSACPDGRSVPDGPVSGTTAEEIDPLLDDLGLAQDAGRAAACAAAAVDGSGGPTSGW